jgi:beta-galactosidase
MPDDMNQEKQNMQINIQRLVILMMLACVTNGSGSEAGSNSKPLADRALSRPPEELAIGMAGGTVGGEGPRQSIPLTEWAFAEDKTAPGDAPAPPDAVVWSQVHIPHIFRQSGLRDNTAGWYRLAVVIPEADSGRHVFLDLEGAASVKDVYVNGRHAGQHKSAYTAAAFDLTPMLNIGGTNRIDVRVSNRDEEVQGMLARSSLYEVNGGMFRKAWLVKTGAVHIHPDMGSSGVYLTPSNITHAKADLAVQTFVRNPLDTDAMVTVRHRVTGPDGAEVAAFSTRATVPAGKTTALSANGVIANPKLWDLGKSNLYTVRTELLVDGKISDAVTERTGIRSIEYANKKFLLNGREVQFRGVNKHAQDEYVYNAMDDAKLRQEWDWMTAMGCNAVRLAHYPHSRLEYDIADERGIAVWAENGFAGQIWAGSGSQGKVVDAAPTPDGERQTREMMRQNWNHPAIFFWSCGNEAIAKTASRYSEVIRGEKDPGRLVTYAKPQGRDEPENCDFVAENTYDGWYGGNYDGFKKDNQLVSETGAGSWVSHHVPYGTIQWSVDKYEPEEYAGMFTEYRLQTLCRNDVANRPMNFWWNFREFYDKKFKGNRNTKGLVSLAGMPKDIAFLFQAFFRPGMPLVHLNGRHHFLRRFAADNGIKAYGNVAELELTVNGVSQGRKKNGAYTIPDATTKNKDGSELLITGIPVENVFFWKTPLAPGRNIIEASDGAGHRDRMIVYQQPVGVPMPVEAAALVQDLHSSNPGSPAVFIDRPVEAQAPFYMDVDGASDNTFDLLPTAVVGASWISTRRLSDPANKTDIDFQINPGSKGATVFMMFSTGTYPVVTLKKPDAALVQAADLFGKSLAAAGFSDTGEKAVWRDHNLDRADAALWSRSVKAGEKVTLPGLWLDAVILVKPNGL